MKSLPAEGSMTRRNFLRGSAAAILSSALYPPRRLQAAAGSDLFWITDIPDQPFSGRGNPHHHSGVDSLLHYMGTRGLKFYRSSQATLLGGPQGLIEASDVVLIKLNTQWKYRGCTNSDLIRGLVQRILEHPDGFRGEVVLFDNGQGRGSVNCDNSIGYGDNTQHANANDERQSFAFLADRTFAGMNVSTYQLDPIGQTFITDTDHTTNGYRLFENVSYPCFTTRGGNRIELREGIWNGSSYSQNIKLINVPVLKYHDGSEITASLKHHYGILSMNDGQLVFRHYDGLGETTGKMVASIRTPVLHILDAIWISYANYKGYPASTTYRANQILAGQDPVALDYWAAKYIFYPVSAQFNPDTPPDLLARIAPWLSGAANTINARGGLGKSGSGILAGQATQNEKEIFVLKRKSRRVYNFNLKVT